MNETDNPMAVAIPKSRNKYFPTSNDFLEGIWKGFGRDLEGIWKGFGRDLEGIWKGLIFT